MFKNTNNQVRSGWVLIFAIAIYVAGQGVCTIPGLTAWTLMKGDALSYPGSDVLAELDAFPWYSFFVNGGGVLGAIIITWALWRIIHKQPMKEMGFRRNGEDFFVGLLLGALSIIIIFILLQVTGQITLENGLLNPLFSTYTLSNLLLYILVGFSEEMFFRGLVVSTLQSRGNKLWVVYLVSALIFGLAHGMNPNVSLLGLFNIFLVGLLFTYMYIESGSLWLSIGYHITWNYFQGNVFGFPVSGTEPHGIYRVTVGENTDFITGGAFGLEGGLMATVLIIAGFLATRWYTSRGNHRHDSFQRRNGVVR